MWFYKSKVGTFKIIPGSNGRYLLYIGDENLGSYHSPDAAADDVYMCATGHYPWDKQLTVTSPTDLGEWQRTR